MRNVLTKVSKGHNEMVAATIRTIFAQPGQPGITDVETSIIQKIEKFSYEWQIP